MGHNLKGALCALAAFALYSTHDVVIKYLGTYYSSFQIMFFAGLLGFPFVTLMLMSDRTDGTLIPRHPWWVLIRSLAALVTGASNFYAFTVLPLAQTYAILFAMPLLITLLAIPMLGERIGPRRAIAVSVGLVGVIIVLRPGSSELAWGHIAVMVAVLAGSLSSVIVRKIGAEERSAVLLLYPMITTFLATGAALPFVYRPMPLAHLGLAAVIAGLAFVAALLTIKAYRAAPAVIVAPMQYSQMIWAVLFGALLFNEAVDVWTLVGSGVIISSGVYIVLREGRGKSSINQPVLSNKSRAETGLMPRISLLLLRGERSGDK